ncbi:MAG: polyprenol monophosphomannose synthase [Patescibacteria group bacterium]
MIMDKNIVIIPTYNEKQNISKLVETIFEILPQIHILVVDDSSPDGTGDVVKDLQKRFPNLSLLARKKKEGLGKAYLNAFEGILKDSDAKNIIMMDADFSHNPSCLPLMLEASSGRDVVIGSRYVKGGGTAGWELWRRLLSRWGNFYARTITRLPIADCTGGFILIKTHFLKKVDFSIIDASGYAFLIEFKYLLWKSGARFQEFPIVFKNRIGGESKISKHIIIEGILAPWKMIFKK